MKSFVLATAILLSIVSGAAAQTADKQGEAGNAPTKSMDAVTPEMKGPGKGEHPPTQQMDKAVPEMKSGGSTTGTSGTKLTQADCDAVWMKANPSNAATITEMEAEQYALPWPALSSPGVAASIPFRRGITSLALLISGLCSGTTGDREADGCR